MSFDKEFEKGTSFLKKHWYWLSYVLLGVGCFLAGVFVAY